MLLSLLLPRLLLFLLFCVISFLHSFSYNLSPFPFFRNELKQYLKEFCFFLGPVSWLPLMPCRWSLFATRCAGSVPVCFSRLAREPEALLILFPCRWF